MTVDKDTRQPQTHTPANRPPRWVRPAWVAAGGVAAVLAWTVARYGAGVHVHTPAASASGHPTDLPAAFVFVVAVIAGAAGWAVLVLLEHRMPHPRRSWVLVAGLVTLVSLIGPLSGHGVSAVDRLSLIAMHLAVAALVIPGLGATTDSHRRT